LGLGRKLRCKDTFTKVVAFELNLRHNSFTLTRTRKENDVPRIKQQSKHEGYLAMKDAPERDPATRADCAVMALANACEVSYGRAQALLANLGRKRNEGTPIALIRKAGVALGFALVRVPLENFIACYPKPHRDVLKSVTSHHPDRFPNAICWAESTYLMSTAGHVLCIKDGKNLDWSRSRALRAESMDLVVKVHEHPRWKES